MVSVEPKAAYWQALRAVPLVGFFIDFLDGEPVCPTSTPDPAEAGSMVEYLLASVRDNDRATATGLYERLTARRLHAESELVHDDFLVFALVCTVRKFQLDDRWVRNLIHLRPTDEHGKYLISKSFENILAGNYNAREDYHQISVVFQLVTGQYQPEAERLHKMVAYLWRNAFPWFDSEFLVIVSMRAIRAAFEVKGLLNPEQRFAVEHFTKRFLNRVHQLSEVMAWLVFGVIIVVLILLNVRYAERPAIKIALAVVTVLTSIGSFTDLRKQLVVWVEWSLKKLFGYNYAPSSTQSKVGLRTIKSAEN